MARNCNWYDILYRTISSFFKEESEKLPVMNSEESFLACQRITEMRTIQGMEMLFLFKISEIYQKLQEKNYPNKETTHVESKEKLFFFFLFYFIFTFIFLFLLLLLLLYLLFITIYY